jgi:hypothetical protein
MALVSLRCLAGGWRLAGDFQWFEHARVLLALFFFLFFSCKLCQTTSRRCLNYFGVIRSRRLLAVHSSARGPVVCSRSEGRVCAQPELSEVGKGLFVLHPALQAKTRC